MELQIRSKNTWRPLVAFDVSDIEQAKQAGLLLGHLSHRVETPVELRILDARQMAVLKMMCPHPWTVPKSAEGYEWLP